MDLKRKFKNYFNKKQIALGAQLSSVFLMKRLPMNRSKYSPSLATTFAPSAWWSSNIVAVRIVRLLRLSTNQAIL